MKTYLLIILLALLPTASYGKERSEPQNSAIAEKPLVCTQANSANCLMYNPPNKQKPTFENLNFEQAIDGGAFIASGKLIRLWGIIPQRKGDKLYEKATLLLEALSKGGRLTCQQVTTDTQGIAVMKCKVDKTDIGSMMIRMGMAQDYWRYSQGFYAYEEDKAQREHRGIWKP